MLGTTSSAGGAAAAAAAEADTPPLTALHAVLKGRDRRRAAARQRGETSAAAVRSGLLLHVRAPCRHTGAACACCSGLPNVASRILARESLVELRRGRQRCLGPVSWLGSPVAPRACDASGTRCRIGRLRVPCGYRHCIWRWSAAGRVAAAVHLPCSIRPRLGSGPRLVQLQLERAIRHQQQRCGAFPGHRVRAGGGQPVWGAELLHRVPLHLCCDGPHQRLGRHRLLDARPRRALHHRLPAARAAGTRRPGGAAGCIASGSLGAAQRAGDHRRQRGGAGAEHQPLPRPLSRRRDRGAQAPTCAPSLCASCVLTSASSRAEQLQPRRLRAVSFWRRVGQVDAVPHRPVVAGECNRMAAHQLEEHRREPPGGVLRRRRAAPQAGTLAAASARQPAGAAAPGAKGSDCIPAAPSHAAPYRSASSSQRGAGAECIKEHRNTAAHPERGNDRQRDKPPNSVG